MTLFFDSFASGIPLFAAALVGLTFLWTGWIKALAPHTFQRHLSTLGWIPRRRLPAAVTAAAAFEAGWGTALILNVAPAIILPASVVLLAALTAISWWGVRSGKASDCGCYGGFIQPSMAQSIGLNAVFAGLLTTSWVMQPASMSIGLWQPIVVLLMAAAAGFVSDSAQRHARKTGIPKFTPSPLKVGASWRHAWARGATRELDGEVLVALLGPDCPFCKEWVRIANVIVQSPTLPKVIGVVGVPEKRRDEFVKNHGIRFPVQSISPSLMSRLTQTVPTTMLVEGGRIREMWSGRMPPEFVARFRRAFFPDAPEDGAGSSPTGDPVAVAT